MSDEFGHRLLLTQIRDGDRIDLVAGEAERRAIAERLGLCSLDRLEAHATIERAGEKVRAHGRLKAVLEQECIATTEPVAARIDEPFDIIFLPEPKGGRPDAEIELSPEECDVVFHDGAAIDLGTAIADELALSLDPYPRSAGAEAALREVGVLTEAEASPFTTLAKLKRDKP
jgi:uncharacterized metal-binding protein YceD (DUF177 family)